MDIFDQITGGTKGDIFDQVAPSLPARKPKPVETRPARVTLTTAPPRAVTKPGTISGLGVPSLKEITPPPNMTLFQGPPGIRPGSPHRLNREYLQWLGEAQEQAALDPSFAGGLRSLGLSMLEPENVALTLAGGGLLSAARKAGTLGELATKLVGTAGAGMVGGNVVSELEAGRPGRALAASLPLTIPGAIAGGLKGSKFAWEQTSVKGPKALKNRQSEIERIALLEKGTVDVGSPEPVLVQPPDVRPAGGDLVPPVPGGRKTGTKKAAATPRKPGGPAAAPAPAAPVKPAEPVKATGVKMGKRTGSVRFPMNPKVARQTLKAMGNDVERAVQAVGEINRVDIEKAALDLSLGKASRAVIALSNKPPTPVDVDKKLKVGTGEINLAQFGDQDDAIAAIIEASHRAAPDMEKKKGGVMPLTEMRKLAETKVIDAKTIERMFHANPNLKMRDIIAVGDYVTGLAKRTKELQKTYSAAREKGIDTDQMRVDWMESRANLDAAMVVLKGTGTEAGRALYAHKIIKQSIDSVRTGKMKMEDLMRDMWKGDAKLEGVMARLEKVPDDPLELMKFYQREQKMSAWDYVSIYRYGNMLGNLATQALNTVGNIASAGTHTAVSAIENPRSFGAGIKGAGAGFKTGIKGAKDIMRHGFSTRESNVLEIPTKELPGGWKNPWNLPLRSMRAVDDIFYQTAYEAKRAMAAKNMARQAGKDRKPGEFLDHADVLSAAEKYAREVTLKPPREGPAGAFDRLMSSARNLPGALGPTFQIVAPFVRVGNEIARQSVELTPGSAVASFATKGGRANARNLMAKQLVGSAGVAAGVWLYDKDNIVLRMPTNEKERKRAYNSGKKPNHFRVGNTWFPLQYLGAAAFPIVVGAAIRDYTEGGGEITNDDALSIVTAVGEYYFNQSFISGPKTGLEALGTNTQAMEMANRLVANTISQFKPGSSALRSVARALDDNFRDPDTWQERLKAEDPFFFDEVKRIKGSKGRYADDWERYLNLIFKHSREK